MGRKAIYPYNIEVGQKAEFYSGRSFSSIKAAIRAYGKKVGRVYEVSAVPASEIGVAGFYKLERTA